MRVQRAIGALDGGGDGGMQRLAGFARSGHVVDADGRASEPREEPAQRLGRAVGRVLFPGLFQAPRPALARMRTEATSLPTRPP